MEKVSTFSVRNKQPVLKPNSLKIKGFLTAIFISPSHVHQCIHEYIFDV